MNESVASAYMAGFFDGEGYVGILKRTRKGKYLEYFIQISIGQKDGKVMDWVKENFGGNLYVIKRDGSYYWTASNKVAYNVLKRIEPYLRYKKPQAEMAIRFFEDKPKGGTISPDEFARREDIYIKLKAQKKIFSQSIL